MPHFPLLLLLPFPPMFPASATGPVDSFLLELADREADWADWQAAERDKEEKEQKIKFEVDTRICEGELL